VEGCRELAGIATGNHDMNIIDTGKLRHLTFELFFAHGCDLVLSDTNATHLIHRQIAHGCCRHFLNPRPNAVFGVTVPRKGIDVFRCNNDERITRVMRPRVVQAFYALPKTTRQLTAGA